MSSQNAKNGSGRSRHFAIRAGIVARARASAAAAGLHVPQGRDDDTLVDIIQEARAQIEAAAAYEAAATRPRKAA